VNHRTANSIALAHARESFQKDLLTRRWNSSSGGVYAIVTDKTKPNPYLSFISESDITTPSGKNLTLINPAYMTRQLYELSLNTGGTAGHITSLKPINPGNKPDDWEAKSLRSFEDNKTEAYTVIEREGKNYLRLMRPLFTEKSCLQCHAKQGYSEGMVRGGISVIVPMPKINITAMLSGHFLLWGLGLIIIVFSWLKIDKAINHRRQAEIALADVNRTLEIRICERTVEYEELNQQLQDEIVERSKVQDKLEHSIKQWRNTFDIMSDFVSVHDKDMRIVKVNKAFADFFEKTTNELIGKHCYEIIHNTNEPWQGCPHLKSIEKHEVITEEIIELRLKKTLLVTCSPIYDINGNAVGTVHVARDITIQKFAQQEREELIKKLQSSLKEVKVLRGILPICCHCKKIRNDEGYYEQMEQYIHEHSEVDFSHTICPECIKKYYSDI
jgi:PAS domain S-box-containing protein